jgi:phosphohistidine phosphatase SixA
MRHGTKDRSGSVGDERMPLSQEGKLETERQANLLEKVDLRPEIYFTSHFQHAEDTGKLLADRLGGGTTDRVKKLCSLTPHSPTETFEEIVAEARSINVDLETAKVILFIGHEPRLSQLLTRLTSSRRRPFSRPEFVCVAADSFEQFLTGQGKIEFSYPVVNHGEEQLRLKVQSKTAVSTFLAGFTATVLFELLLKEGALGISRAIAAVSLTVSLALFIAAVYMYDRLSMPEGFWIDEERPSSQLRRGKAFEQHLRTNGPLYALMIWTWDHIFTSAVAFGLVGFVTLLLSTGNSFLLAGAVAALIAVGIGYFLFRPKLGND